MAARFSIWGLATLLLMVVCLLSLPGIGEAQIRFKPPKPKAQQKPAAMQADSLRAAAPQVPAAVRDSSVTSPSSSSAALPIPDSIVVPQIDFSNQPIQDVLRLLCAPYAINLSVDPGLRAAVTVRLAEIKLRDAFEFIVRENGFAQTAVDPVSWTEYGTD